MADLFSEFKKYFTLNNVDIDNWTFKLFSKASVAIFLLASAACMATTYFGDAIDCTEDSGGKFDKFAHAYCWAHGTFHVTKKSSKLAKALYGDGVCRNILHQGEQGTDTDWYQWVVFMLCVHGFIFMIPDQLWQFWEGGLMESFGTKKDKSNATLDEHAKNFTKLSNKRSIKYFVLFSFCEFLNVIAAALNFWLINKFLNGKFNSYGHDVIAYFRSSDTENLTNPMCSVFPTITSCVYHTGAVTGDKPGKHSLLCFLGQNVVNEKIYLGLWFWLIFLFFASAMTFIAKLLSIAVPGYRLKTLQHFLGTTRREHETFTGTYWKDNNKIGAWFILCQIGRNSSPYYFRALLSKIANADHSTDAANAGETMALQERQARELV